ncbi:hypothetical protein MRX96_019087 [Rhipicephalus microplus]
MECFVVIERHFKGGLLRNAGDQGGKTVACAASPKMTSLHGKAQKAIFSVEHHFSQLLPSERPSRRPACLLKSSTEGGGPFATRLESPKDQWKRGHTCIGSTAMNEMAPLPPQPKVSAQAKLRLVLASTIFIIFTVPAPP